MLEKERQIGRYKILSALGAGGMGEVYSAEDARLNRKVALKVLPENIATDKERLRRFEQEARAASALNHPNILTVYEFGFEQNVHFLATELIDGETLREAMNGELSLSEAINIAEQIAFALSAAHAAGIVHRDLKPENIMIRRDKIVKVLDFGLAKLIEKRAEKLDAEAETRALVKTNPGAVMGTVAYMSPEQARGQETDARTDVWSLGVVLYEIVSGGKQPFAGESMNDVIASILKSEPPLISHYISDVPNDLEKIVGKCLRKNRDERYQNIKDLQIDLKDLRQELEFQNKFERSLAPNKNSVKTIDENHATQILEIEKTKDLSAPQHQPSSAEYLVGEIKNHKRGFLAVLGFLLLAAIGFGYWLYAHRSASTDARQINSIAVLPFENGSGDAGLDYLSDGLSESLIDKLSQLPQLKVIARNSSFKYRGADIDVQDAAQKLGVRAIVMGKVVRVGDNLSVRVEMIDADENRQLWSELYNRKTSDMLAVQQEIAQTASEKLRLKLSGAQEQRLAELNTVNPQAYELLLKGRFYANTPGAGNRQKAADFYNQAIAIDPGYALAYAELSRIYRLMIINSNVDPKEFRPKAEAALRKAIELDANLPEAHLAQAVFYNDSWDWAAADPEFKRTIELNPNFGAARRGYASFLGNVGRYDESIAEAKRARELDPLSVGSSVQVALSFHYARRFDEAIEAAQTLEPKQWSYSLLCYSYAGKGMFNEAAANCQEAIKTGNTSPSIQIYFGAATARAGEREKAQAILKQLETRKEYVSPAELAILYGALGDKDAAFRSLEKGFAEHDPQLQYLKADPSFDTLRDDPRFQDLNRRVGLPQ